MDRYVVGTHRDLLEECMSEETRIEKSREVFACVLAPWAYGSGFESNLPYQLCLVETVFVKISLH